MNFTSPPPLKPGDTIGVMAPSSRIARADIDEARAFFEGKGFKVLVHSQTYLYAGPEYSNQYAGSRQEKLDAFHHLVANPDVKAIIFATGGQRAITLLDDIDYELVAANPKIYMGFSDHTALCNTITARTGLITYHGPTLRRSIVNPQIDFNLRLLAGGEKSIPLKGSHVVKSGKGAGVLFGGNLAMIRCLNDSDMAVTDGGILFLEEISEELSTVDRDLCSLKRRGIFKRLNGLMLGQFTNMKDTGTPFGMTMQDIIAEHTEGLKIPVISNAPFGHDTDLYAFPIGARVALDTKSLTLKLTEA